MTKCVKEIYRVIEIYVDIKTSLECTKILFWKISIIERVIITLWIFILNQAQVYVDHVQKLGHLRSLTPNACVAFFIFTLDHNILVGKLLSNLSKRLIKLQLQTQLFNQLKKIKQKDEVVNEMNERHRIEKTCSSLISMNYPIPKMMSNN